MRIVSLYRNFIKNNLFIKIILLFSCITILTILTLSYLMFNFMSQSIVEGVLSNQKKTMESANAYMNAKYQSVQDMVSDVYREPTLSQNVSFLLKNQFPDYFKFRIDQYTDNARAGTANALSYFKTRLDNDPDIQNLMLYSAEKQYLYAYNDKNTSRLIETNAARSFIPDVMALQTANVSMPNLWVRKAIGQNDPHLYAVRAPINDETTMKNIGQLLVYFSSDGILGALGNDSKELTGYILILTSDGQVMFDSSGRYYGQKYPYANRIDSLYQTGKLEEDSYISTLTQNVAGYTVVGVAPKAEVAESYQALLRTILLISGICIVFAIVVPSLFIMNFAKRTKKIIRFMRKVETGDLTVRIQEEREDELGQISKSFNQMLDELARHIDRVYKAEIKQKHTELSALQARVNPHFLYNTLEVIRMRAISQGVTDVGEMIYSLAVLFKSFVQQQNVVTLREEMENCERYLELFRIRYQNNFSYSIDMDSRLEDRKVMKLSLQPMIENYIVHGISQDRNDNRITIQAAADEDMLRIRIADNGNGMPPERLQAVLGSLSLPTEDEDGNSFGLHSVYERLRLLYGKQAGMEIESEEGTGTIITIWFPDLAEEVNSNVPGFSGG